MTKRTLIKNATVVYPGETIRSNVVLESGKIAAVDVPASTTAELVIDATGLHLLPGVIDDQVHFREPGLTHKEDIETGSRGCAAGGITTFLEMPNTNPPSITMEALQWKYSKGQQVSRVNFGFYVGATSTNCEVLQQASFAPGIKIFIGSSTGNLLVDEQSALEQIFSTTSLPICAHCEDETTVRANRERIGPTNSVADHSRIRDVTAAVVATKRAIDLALRHKHRFHVLHVSTLDELPLIENKRPYITAEVCPHHLFFSTNDYERLGTLVQMNPSLKSPEHGPALWNALLDGRVQVIATDHAPHTLAEKRVDYPSSPSGLPAVENSLALILNQVNQGRCTLQQVASWMSDAPARVWDLVGKGRIAVGYDADLVLVDMNLEKTIVNEEQYTRSGWSPWAGERLKGWPVITIVHGEIVYQNGSVNEAVRGQAVVCDHQRGGFWATPDGIGT